MLDSKLSEHIFRNGRFTTRFLDFFKEHGIENSWFINRMPLYVWLGLIIDKYGHSAGIQKCGILLKKLTTYKPDILVPSFSEILSLSLEKQDKFFDYCLQNIDKSILSPLTILYTFSDSPVFSRKFLIDDESIEQRIKKIIDIMDELSNHQSDISTDIRFLIIYTSSITHKLHIREGLPIADALREYPFIEHTDIKMRHYRPSIRACEINYGMMGSDFSKFLNDFWTKVSVMTDCKLIYIEHKSENLTANQYAELLHEIMCYYSELISSAAPLDNKMLVLVGISTYAYKRLNEIAANNIANTIVARGTVRVLVECYIMIKYLLQLEIDKPENDIWQEFQYYGIGQYKLVFERYNEFYSDKDLTNSHVDYSYIDLLVRDYKIKEFIEMDTSYFDKKGIRDKAILVSEKELYDLYYDYDSAFEHGLWGAILESSLLKCTNPAHQYHLVPDCKSQQKMKSVWSDCIKIMNKIVFVLNSLYGLPSNMLEEIQKHEN